MVLDATTEEERIFHGGIAIGEKDRILQIITIDLVYYEPGDTIVYLYLGARPDIYLC